MARLFRRRTHSKKKFILLLGVAVVLLLIIGGGTYALFLGGSSGPSASTNSVNLSKGLVGQWKFDGNLKDSTPYSNDCTMPYVDTPIYGTDHEGKDNSAIYNYDNYGQVRHIECGPSPVFNTGQKFTLSAWVDPTSWNTTGDGIIDCTSYSFYFDNDSHLTARLANTASESLYFSAINAYSTNHWYNVVMSFDGSTVKLYSDGNQVLSSSMSDYAPGCTTDQILEIGTYFTPSSDRDFEGYLDDVRMYNRALSANEVTALYNTYDSSVQTDSGEKGLVGEWKMNGNYKDSTPYATDCEPQYFTPSYVADQHGRANSAMLKTSYTGTGFECGSPTALQLSSTLTLSAWVNTSSFNSDGNGIISYGIYSLYLDPSGHLELELYDPGAVAHDFSSPTAYTAGQWYHVAATYDGTTVKLYVNGSQVLSTSYTSGLNSAYSSHYFQLLNWYTNSSNRTFYGSIDDIRAYNRALSATEISNLYNSYNSQISLGGSGQSGSVSLGKGLVGYWPMNGNAKDATPYSDNGTVNGATLTTDRKGRANSAYSFNGTSNYIEMDASTYPAINAPASTVAWINASSLTTARDIVDRFASGGGTPPGIQFRLTTSGTLQLTGSGEALLLTGNTALSTGQWYMVAYTFDGTTAKLYINGSLDKSGSVTPQVGATAYFSVGSYGSGEFFAGSIDDVRIYNRALSAAEVQALYKEYQ